MDKGHESVLLLEAVDALHIKNQALYVDATLGGGGHTIEILKRGGKVIGIEADKSIIEIAKNNIEEARPVPHPLDGRLLHIVNGNAKDIDLIVKNYTHEPVFGVLYDLGVSNYHFGSEERGFSFKNPKARLDMRLDPDTQSVTAADLLNLLREDQLFELFRYAMDYKSAKKSAFLIVNFRKTKKFETVGDLLDAIESWKSSNTKVHPSTKAFLALRIAVNRELDNAEESINKAVHLLEKSGRLSVITFHSTEDRLVKNIFKALAESHKVKIITKKPITPSADEIERNIKSRSAKLRVIEKL